MSKLIFNPKHEMKELIDYGFEEYNNGYTRKYNSGYETFINKITKCVFDIEITDTHLIIQDEVTRADDLKKANLIIDEEELNDGIVD